MLSSTLFTRCTTGGLATVLAATGAVVATGPAASAAGGTATYTCTMPIIGPVSVPVTTSIPDFPTELPEGSPVGTYDASFVLGVVPTLATLLGSVTGESVAGFEMPLGDTAVPVGGFGLGALEGVSGSQTMSGSSTTGAFPLPAPGTYELTMPESLTFLGTSGLGAVAAPCVIDAPAVLGTLTVLPGGEPAIIPSTTEATVVKKRIIKGHRAKIKALSVAGVAPLTQAAVGDVIVRKRKRTIGQGTLEAGETVIRTERFKKPGRYRLTVKYLGDALTEASTDQVVVRVVRRRR